MTTFNQQTTSRLRSPDQLPTPARAEVAAPPVPPAAMPFIDLQSQRRRIAGAVDRAIAGVLAHGQFIMGPEVKRLEYRLAAHCGAGHAIGCGSGSEALLLALLALDARPGDAVFVPSFTFTATAEMVALIGATPVFVDVAEDDFNMAPASLAAAIEAVAAEGRLRPAGVIAVDLFGQPADYAVLHEVAVRHRLWVIADAAQSYGARAPEGRVGTLAAVTTTSFFPAKPLGCYGDGGAVLTDDDGLAETVRSLLFHGRSADRRDMVRIGLNGRLDTIQAAVLLEKLEIFEDELRLRQAVADRYEAGLRDVARTPPLKSGRSSSWAQYTILLDGRDRVEGIPTAIHYALPVHRQSAYRSFPVAPDGLPVTEALSRRVLSLPMHPYLDEVAQGRVIAAVRAAAG